jgi:hypothetical protein
MCPEPPPCSQLNLHFSPLNLTIVVVIVVRVFVVLDAFKYLALVSRRPGYSTP